MKRPEERLHSQAYSLATLETRPGEPTGWEEATRSRKSWLAIAPKMWVSLAGTAGSWPQMGPVKGPPEPNPKSQRAELWAILYETPSSMVIFYTAKPHQQAKAKPFLASRKPCMHPMCPNTVCNRCLHTAFMVTTVNGEGRVHHVPQPG